MYFTFSALDLFTIAIYFAIFFAIIVISSRGVKSGKDFKLSDTKFGTFAIMATQGASMKGSGSLVNYAGGSMSNGLGVLMAAQAPNLGGWMGAITGIARRLKVTSRELTIASMGDIFYHRYGNNKVRLPSTIGPIMISISFAALQMSAVGMVLHMAFYNSIGLTFNQGVFIAGVINLVCTLSGGVKSVIWTDVYQWWIMTPVMFILLPIFCWKNGVTFEAVKALDPGMFVIKPDASWVSLVISGVLSCTIDLVYVIRYVTSKDERSSVRGTALGFLYTSLWAGVAVFFGIAAAIIFMGQEIPSDQVLYTLASTILPSGLLGLFIAGLMATTISTSDSYLHTAVVTCTTDILPYFRKGKAEFDDKQALRADRITTAILTVASVVFVLYVPALKTLLNFGLSINAVTMFCPIMAALFWDKSEEYGSIAGILGGLVAFAISQATGKGTPVTVGVIVSAILVIAIGLIRNKSYAKLPGFRKGDSKPVKGMSQDAWIAIGGCLGALGGVLFSVGFSRWLDPVVLIVGLALFLGGIRILSIGVPKKEEKTAEKQS